MTQTIGHDQIMVMSLTQHRNKMPNININSTSFSLLPHSANHTSTAYATLATAVPTVTEPTKGVLELGTTNPQQVHIIPMWSGTTVSTAIGMRVLGWSSYKQNSGVRWYVPTIITDYDFVVSSTAVTQYTIETVASTFVSKSTVVASTSVNGSAANFSPAATSAAAIDLASIIVNVYGHQKITVQFKVASGTMAALYKFH